MKPTIVHILSTLQSSGPQRLVLDLQATPELANYQHKVVCIFTHKGELEPVFQTRGVAVHPCRIPIASEVPLPSYRLARWVGRKIERTFPSRLAHLLGTLGADLVHTHVTSRIDLQTIGVVQKAGLPLVWTIHGLQSKDVENHRRRQHAWQLLRNGAGWVTAVSVAAADDMALGGIIPRTEIQVIFGGVDLSRFRAVAPTPLDWRRRLNLPADAVLFGAVGLLQREKAHDVLIEAAARLRQNTDKAYFVIAGPGPLRDELLARIEGHGLRDRFHLVGYQADIPNLLNQLDVFVFPSRLEGFGLALVEAAAAKLPIIASAVGGIPEILGAEGGLLVPADDPAALTEALQQMLAPEVRERYASASPAVANRFSIGISAAQFAHLYAALLGQE